RFLRQVRQEAELDLRVVGGDETPAGCRHEGGADAPAFFGAYGDVLQVGIRAGEPAGRRDRLVEGRVHPTGGRVDQRRQGIDVRRLELRQGAELEDLRRQRVLAREARQDVDVGRQPGLSAPHATGRDLQVVEEHLAQLGRRVDVEGAAGSVVDL